MLGWKLLISISATTNCTTWFLLLEVHHFITVFYRISKKNPCLDLLMTLGYIAK